MDFGIVVLFAIGSVFIVVVQAVALAMLVSWNKELRREVEVNKPPF